MEMKELILGLLRLNLLANVLLQPCFAIDEVHGQKRLCFLGRELPHPRHSLVGGCSWALAVVLCIKHLPANYHDQGIQELIQKY